MTKDLAAAIRPTLVLTLLFAALTGLAYPALVTALGQLLFPAQANGSLIERDGHVIGSELIAQGFASPRYFHPRPSAAGKGWDATNSGGSNYGPAARPLVDRVKGELATLGKEGNPVPADLVTASGSGLDPDISPEAARFQIARVAAAQHLSPEAVSTVVSRAIQYPLLGFIGEPRVNVLMLNLALDKEAASGAKSAR